MRRVWTSLSFTALSELVKFSSQLVQVRKLSKLSITMFSFNSMEQQPVNNLFRFYFYTSLSSFHFLLYRLSFRDPKESPCPSSILMEERSWKTSPSIPTLPNQKEAPSPRPWENSSSFPQVSDCSFSSLFFAAP